MILTTQHFTKLKQTNIKLVRRGDFAVFSQSLPRRAWCVVLLGLVSVFWGGGGDNHPDEFRDVQQ